MVEIKICGITKEIEIDYINSLKPEYIGFVFAESKRKVVVEEVINLKQKLDKDILTVGVFRNNKLEDVLDIYKKTALDVIQLHGDEDAEYIKAIKKEIGSNTKLWKAIGVKGAIERDAFEGFEVDKFLLDSSTPGEGTTFKWGDIDLTRLPKGIIIAGGINTENVVQAMEIFSPDVVDLSSSVEEVDNFGVRMKSYEKMKNLMEKVRDKHER